MYLVDALFGSESIPHDDSPQILFFLQILDEGGKLLSNMDIVVAYLCHPKFSSIVIAIDFFADAFVIQFDCPHYLLFLSQEVVFEVIMQEIALVQFVYLYDLIGTIY